MEQKKSKKNRKPDAERVVATVPEMTGGSDKVNSRTGSSDCERQLAVQSYLNSIIAHNLTGPLQGMLGFTGFLAEDFEEEGDERRARYMTLLRETASTLYQTIVNVVLWSRTVKESIVPEDAPVYIKDLLEEGLLLNRGSILTKELTMTVNLRDLGMIRSDKVLLGIVTGNLLQYAIRNCEPKGTITIGYTKKKESKTVLFQFQGSDLDVEICKRYARVPLRPERFSGKEINNVLGLITAFEIAAMLGVEISMKALITKEVRINMNVNGQWTMDNG